MYQYSYSEILADSPTDARAEERRALDRAITLLHLAEDSTPKSKEEGEAMAYVAQLWGLFIKSLASPDNDLPDPLRANLMSIGLGVMAEVGRIETGESRDFTGLAEICGIVRDGLA
jgi:flagellar protein FlaF